ncbi:MAG: fibronectin type III domain-containing protein [Planctomycetes bacterium]|nr:fibronectin type III domain-containing protein [Planctomycetota bacterium]
MSTLVTRVNSFVAAQFGLTNLTGVAPNDLTAGAQTAGTEATHYGLVLAGLSQEAGTAAVAVMPLINAIGTDFQTDGSFNGLNVGAPVVLGGGNLSTTASTSWLATGMTAFLGGGQNASTIAAAAESAFITPISAASAPAVPAGLAGTPGSMTVTLTWNGVPGAATYNVYMAGVTGVTPANYGSLAGGMAHTTVASPFFHAGLAPGPYYFIVTAVNGAGEGLPSGELYLIVP